MKNLTLTLLFVVLFSGINAQEKVIANKFVLGGSINFISQKNTYPLSILDINFGVGSIFSNGLNDSKNTIFRFNPYVGRELNPHWIIGLQLSYASQHYRADDVLIFSQPQEPNQTADFSRKSQQIGIGSFARYTINPLQRFNFFLQPSVNYNFFRDKTAYDGEVTQKEKANFIEVGVGVGILYQVNDLLRITLRSGGLGYLNGNWEIEDTEVSRDFSSFSGNLNLSNLSFGVELRL